MKISHTSATPTYILKNNYRLLKSSFLALCISAAGIHSAQAADN